MNSAFFLLIINLSLGVLFALAFLALSFRDRIILGFYSSVGFLLASTTVGVEALAQIIPSSRLTSFLSFSSFMGALLSICIGMFRHYRESWSVKPIITFSLFCVLAQPFVIFNMSRDGFAHALAYQAPFAIICMVAAMAVFLPSTSHRSFSDYTLATVLLASGLQFLLKALMAIGVTTGPSVTGYIYSKYAYYSQTAGTILSLALGVALLTVIAHESLLRMRRSLQRDPLSGLWNRGAFFEYASESMKVQGRKKYFIICDLDHFKSINDVYGHASGDEVIRVFGRMLLDLERNANPICGRIGGEEFAIFLIAESASHAENCINSVQDALAQYCFTFMTHPVTASYGIAPVLPHEIIDQSLARADGALYRAKAEGRNRYSFAQA